MSAQPSIPGLPRLTGKPAALVVDDSRTGRRIVETLLGILGFEVASASGVKDALESIETRRFALFTVDRNLDGEDGVALVAALRRSAACGDDPRIIAVTGHVGEEHSEAFFAAGADAYLSKPFTVRDLAAVLEALGFSLETLGKADPETAEKAA